MYTKPYVARRKTRKLSESLPGVCDVSVRRLCIHDFFVRVCLFHSSNMILLWFFIFQPFSSDETIYVFFSILILYLLRIKTSIALLGKLIFRRFYTTHWGKLRVKVRDQLFHGAFAYDFTMLPTRRRHFHTEGKRCNKSDFGERNKRAIESGQSSMWTSVKSFRILLQATHCAAQTEIQTEKKNNSTSLNE